MDNAELQEHLNALLDELKWFHSQDIGLRISPKAKGWNLSILTPTTSGSPFRDEDAEAAAKVLCPGTVTIAVEHSWE